MNKNNREVKDYNDYIVTTKRYLRDYYLFKTSYKEISNNIKRDEEMLRQEAAAPIAKYSDDPAGGFSELNTIEMTVERRLRMMHEINDRKNDAEELKRIIIRLESAINALEPMDKDLVCAAYIDRLRWDMVGARCGYSPRWAKNKAEEALEKLALILFGIKARQDRLFVFFG